MQCTSNKSHSLKFAHEFHSVDWSRKRSVVFSFFGVVSGFLVARVLRFRALNPTWYFYMV